MNIKCSLKLLFKMIKRVMRGERLHIISCIHCGHSDIRVLGKSIIDSDSVRKTHVECRKCSVWWIIKENFWPMEEVEDD